MNQKYQSIPWFRITGRRSSQK